MGPVDFIVTAWEKEQKVFNKNLAALKQDPEKEAVHDLRVAVKKLRAALELYLLVSGKSIPADALKNTERLFSILGKQRDIEICLELLEAAAKENKTKYPEPESYLRTVLSVTYTWTQTAVAAYKKKELAEIARLLKNDTWKIEPEILKLKIAGIIDTRIAACREVFKKPHKLRQRLKEIYYWLKMIPGSLFTPLEYETALHDLLDDFGDWQNLTVFETKLRHYRKDFLPKEFPEYEAIKWLEGEVNSMKEKLLKQAMRKTSLLLKKNMGTGKPSIS